MIPCFATIASSNYLAYVAVLRDSIRRYVPAARLEVLLVDARTPEIDDAILRLNLNATYAHELALPNFEHLSFKFDVLELNTALKPSFLKMLLGRGFARVVYFDPDIYLYAEPTPVFRALDTSEIVLTPHSLAPVLDGKRPSDIDYLRLGTYNLGFIAVRAGKQSSAMLNWWERRCLGWGFNDFTFGIFVDQKWIDLAPSYFDSVQILKHPGCNVAYWNLHERTVARREETWYVNGQPLIFFHFSGVNASAPNSLSRHQTRHVPEPGSSIAQLVEQYCAKLVSAGHLEFNRLRYGFGYLDDGTPITTLMRRASCCPGVRADSPFSSKSSLYEKMRKSGLVARQPESSSSTNTLNFDATKSRVRVVNGIIRLLTRVLGAERMGQLLRYAAFLSWGSNFAAVLMKQPFDLSHCDPDARESERL